ncbi:MAG TPA: inorganic phosphate transporter [Solirubrobacterales bacterium]|nr:inorganic phosphate transporter [Solirubrobacterales bacterium]
MSSDLVIGIVVGAALLFAFTNGFHDTLDLISTALSSGAAPPQVAIALTALLNFLGAFVSISVATTISQDVVVVGQITPMVVFAGLLAAIAWNLATWKLGYPSSSSHALIGGVVGAALAAAGTDALDGSGLLDKVLLPALAAPLVAFLVAAVLVALAYLVFGRRRPGPVGRGFRSAQVVSGGLLAAAHGANDGQKTSGVITLALIANGSLGPGHDPPFWTILCAAIAIGLGTYSGGWRILRATGARILKMDPAQGFSAQSGGALTIVVATALGYPISTTHAINGGVMGAGTVRRVSAQRWGIAGNIVAAWLLTLPAAAALGAAIYGITRIFGTGALGPVLVTLVAAGLIAAFFSNHVRRETALPAEGR